MTKTELRSIYLARQKALAAPERTLKSRRIARRFFECTDLAKVRLLHCFIPIEKFNEVDTVPMIRALRVTLPEIVIVVPRVNFATGEMESLRYSAETELVENKWGIHEPPAGAAVTQSEIDMVLVPGLAFDLAGHRVGYGKGFYDRFLRRCRPGCAKIGLSYFEPVDEISDVHQGDTRLDACITPDGIFTAEKRRCGDLP